MKFASLTHPSPRALGRDGIIKMPYELTLIVSDEEEYPYSESLDGDSYYYKVSIVFNDKDGELQVMNEGVHIEFDNGEWMDFLIPPPNKLFPNKSKLSQEDLFKLMDFLVSDKVKTKPYSESDIEKLT